MQRAAKEEIGIYRTEETTSGTNAKDDEGLGVAWYVRSELNTREILLEVTD